tara:strand:- start:84 stop:275 length:192 start_codon:yes stop_codon:yes gene_type:complete
MTEIVRKYWFVIPIVVIVLMLFLSGCVEVGGSSTGIDVCSGTECSENHDESDRSTDNSDNSSD